ncbi:probable proteasome inhibitor [Impatiens glandulifera]|uniref:probable proteasome inhibitor n=1 Tax=Impatiens glandulifera TaxID=253017 RepID=UPI001FB0705A|nr:probable proteasome inhibitor [Impatiens glandulifera]
MANDQSVLAVIRASRPSFKNPHDRIAFSVHASFLASGYILHAAGPAAFAEDALSSSSTDVEVGIDHWNDANDEYAFIYSNPDKGSKKVLIKCLAMNDMLMVDGIEDNGSDPLHLELNVGNYTAENGGANYASQFKDLDKLVSIVDKEVLSKLEGRPKKAPASTSNAEPSSYIPRTRVIEPEPLNPVHEPYNSGYIYPPIAPFGGSDILPGPGAGIYPLGRGRDDFDGGMFVGPNSSMFGRMGRQPSFPGAPPGLGVPPGARFDPFGPPGVPGFEPNRFGRNSRGSGRNHPDLEPFPGGSDFI